MENGNDRETNDPKAAVRQVREDAARAFHEYRKALMPLVGVSEYSARKCGELFASLETFAQELPEPDRAAGDHRKAQSANPPAARELRAEAPLPHRLLEQLILATTEETDPGRSP